MQTIEDVTTESARRFVARCRRIAADFRRTAGEKDLDGDVHGAERARAAARHWEKRADKVERDFAEVAA